MTTAGGDGRVAARPQMLRSLNEQLLLGHVRRSAPVSRPELARLSGLSKPTVAQVLAGLERDGLVRVAGQRTGMRGPMALLYELRPEAGYVLGLDVGREYIRGALSDLSGAVRVRLNRRAPRASARERVSELGALAQELLDEAGAEPDSILQTVVGSPGVFDPAREALRMAPNLPGWEQPQVVRELRRLLGPSTVVENDIDLAAIAERDHGHGRDAATFAFVSVGTGIGMGLVIDGQLHRGVHGAAGEIAYLPLGPRSTSADAEVRQRGALEAEASSAAVVRSARAAGLDGHLTARRVFAAAAAGDERARAVVVREASLVATALAAVVAVVDPELIVLGGGIGGAAGFADAVAAELERVAPFVPEIRVTALGDDAVVRGSLAAGTELVWERVLRSRDVD